MDSCVRHGHVGHTSEPGLHVLRKMNAFQESVTTFGVVAGGFGGIWAFAEAPIDHASGESHAPLATTKTKVIPVSHPKGLCQSLEKA